MYNEPGLKFAEPGYEKHCILKSRQHITFGHYTEATGGSGHNVWYKKLLDARTKEGIEVSLEIDIEWEYDESQLDKTILRTGVTNPIERLYVAARSSIRNSAKKFNATDFIEDGRKAISQQMFADLQDYFESDGIYIKVCIFKSSTLRLFIMNCSCIRRLNSVGTSHPHYNRSPSPSPGVEGQCVATVSYIVFLSLRFFA